MTLDQFEAQLGMWLRDHPSGAAAELTDFAVAYWDGHRLVYAFLRDDGTGCLDEEFDLRDYQWSEWEKELVGWAARPRFSSRDEVFEWLKEAPPADAG